MTLSSWPRTVEHPCETPLEHGVRQAGVPDKVVGVHAAALVAATAEHGEVGGQLEVPWRE